MNYVLIILVVAICSYSICQGILQYKFNAVTIKCIANLKDLIDLTNEACKLRQTITLAQAPAPSQSNARSIILMLLNDYFPGLCPKPCEHADCAAARQAREAAELWLAGHGAPAQASNCLCRHAITNWDGTHDSSCPESPEYKYKDDAPAASQEGQ